MHLDEKQVTQALEQAVDTVEDAIVHGFATETDTRWYALLLEIRRIGASVDALHERLNRVEREGVMLRSVQQPFYDPNAPE